MYAALDDDLLADLCGLDGKLEAVANNVGDTVIYLRCLVVMGQNDRISFLLEPVDLKNQRGIEGPFDLGDLVAHPVVHLGGGALDGLGEFQIEVLGEYGARLI